MLFSELPPGLNWLALADLTFAGKVQHGRPADVSAGWSMLERAMAGESLPDDSNLHTSAAEASSPPQIAAQKGGVKLEGKKSQDRPAVKAMASRQDAWTSDTPMPRLKRPEELRELIRICELPLQNISGWTETPWHPEEVAVQQVRLTGRRWYEFLEDEDLIDTGKDPARFPLEVRERYIQVIAAEGLELVSEEAAALQMAQVLCSALLCSKLPESTQVYYLPCPALPCPALPCPALRYPSPLLSSPRI